MPKLSLKDLKTSFELEADKYFPFPKDQIYTDCFILDSSSQERKMSVLVSAAKKDLINERIKFLEDLGLQAEFIGINSLALANVCEVLKDKLKIGDDQNSALGILDIGETVANLLIVHRNLPRFNRDIFVGGEELTKRISNVLGIGIPEAENLKCHPNERWEEVFATCDSLLTNLVSEVRLSFDYFVTENNIPVSKLFLTGGTAKLKGIREFFAKALDMPVEKWDPFVAFKFSPQVKEEEVRKNSDHLATALGLALYQI